MATKTLFSGVSENVRVRDLGDLMMKRGVFATIKCSRNRGTIPMPDEMKKNYKSAEAVAAAAAHSSPSHLVFTSKELDNKLNKIESAIRYELKKASFANGFISLEELTGFTLKFEAAVEEYDRALDTLGCEWDQMIENFKADLDFMLYDDADLTDIDRIRIRKAVYKKIPSYKEFRSDCCLKLSVRQFNPQPNLELFPEDLQGALKEDWKESVTECAVACVTSCVQDVFERCSCVAARYADTAYINKNSINGLQAVSERIRKNNLFNNPLLASAADRLEHIADFATPDEQEIVIEDVLLDVYAYSKQNGVSLTIDPKGLKESTLDQMLALRS